MGPFLLLHGCAVAMNRGHAMNGLPIVQRSLATNGFVVHWAEHAGTGSATPIVFVHGTPGDASAWRTQLANPPGGRSVVAIDRPGFEESTPVRAEPHLEEQAQAVVEVARAVTEKKVILVGHSYGGPVVLLAALEHPEKVAGIVLVGGSIDPGQEALWWIQYPFHYRVLSWTIPQPLRQANREIFTLKDDLIALRSRLPELQVPVVMVHGDQDPLVPVENVAYLERELAKVGKESLLTEQVYPGWNHFIPWEHPDAVTRAVETLDAKMKAEAGLHSAKR